jgi:hypothetical protein
LVKNRKQAKGRPQKRGFPWFAWLGIGLGIVATIAFVRTYPISGPAGSSHPGEPKAAIIDQLYSLQPNEAFIGQVTNELEDCGFKVDLYQGDEVTVDFYGKLASYGYKLIVFRAHSGLLGSKGETIERTCLFTNEPYSQAKHVAEQLSDRLARARIDEYHPWVFGIGDEFVTQSMEGEFDHSVIIMMGCSCLYLEDLAQAFIDKGASAYLAWDATVELDYVDKATPYLIGRLCAEKATIGKAVTSTMNVIGPDPKHGARLNYYPPQSGDKTLRELTQPLSR